MAKLLLGSVVGPQGPQGTPGVNGSQGPQGVPGPNEIAVTTDVVGLTSGQLLYNNGGKVGSVEIVDDLASTATDKPLSANQGKALKGLIDGNSSAIGQNSNDLTAHEASTVYKVWQISRDLSISGDQIISGIGFKPKSVIAISAVLAEVGKFSTGFSGGVGNTIGIFDFPNVPGSYGADATLIQIHNSYTNITKAIVKSFDTDGLTLTWSKAGTGATGTCIINLLVFGH